MLKFTDFDFAFGWGVPQKCTKAIYLFTDQDWREVNEPAWLLEIFCFVVIDHYVSSGMTLQKMHFKKAIHTLSQRPSPRPPYPVTTSTKPAFQKHVKLLQAFFRLFLSNTSKWIGRILEFRGKKSSSLETISWV